MSITIVYTNTLTLVSASIWQIVRFLGPKAAMVALKRLPESRLLWTEERACFYSSTQALARGCIEAISNI